MRLIHCYSGSQRGRPCRCRQSVTTEDPSFRAWRAGVSAELGSLHEMSAPACNHPMRWFRRGPRLHSLGHFQL